MIGQIDSNECCGCGACVQKCPKRCISMRRNVQGFMHPVLDKSLCVKCGLCTQVCPILSNADSLLPLTVLAAINNDQSVRNDSSSGGIFNLLATFVLKKGGVVFGVRFDEEWNAIHDFTDSVVNLKYFRGSKYIQSDMGYCFQKAEYFLKQKRFVLFTGTPCQIAGLNSFLNKEYDNLLTVDLVCHGVPSPKVWKSYIDYSFGTRKQSIKGISFRDKSKGWSNYGLKFKFDNVYHREDFKNNLYMRGYLSNFFLRSSCYNCLFKRRNSGSDVTIGDLWGIHHFLPELDDDKGVSLVMINSEKGKTAFNELTGSFTSCFVEYQNALKYNTALEKSVRKPEQYNFFWKRFEKVGCVAIVDALNYKLPLAKRVLRKLKRLF